jgi:hypothetical protein
MSCFADAAPNLDLQRVTQHLHLLDTLCVEKAHDNEELSAVLQAIQAETKLWCKLNHEYIKLLTDMVNYEEYAEASEAVRRNFPGVAGRASSFGFFMEEILAQLCVNNVCNNAIEWLEFMDADQQLVAFKILYQLLKSKELLLHPEALLLLKSAKRVPAGFLRARLEGKCRRIIERVGDDLKHRLFHVINTFPGRAIASYFMPQIVHQFDVRFVENVLLLVDFADYFLGHDTYGVSTSVVCTLLKELEERLLLDSLQTMHVWTLAKSIENYACFHGLALEQQFTAAWDKLNKLNSIVFRYYQGYVEDRDKKNLKNLHVANGLLESIVPDFVSWYFNGDPERIYNLYESARCGLGYKSELQILRQMQVEMIRMWPTAGTFEFFCFYNEVEQFSWRLQFAESYSPALVEELEKFKIPYCAHLLHQSTHFKQQLRLVNKHFDLPLCVQEEQFFCCKSHIKEDELCAATVNAATSLTTICFASRDTCWKLDAANFRALHPLQDGTQWKLIAVDEYHVKIFTADGKKGSFILIISVRK